MPLYITATWLTAGNCACNWKGKDPFFQTATDSEIIAHLIARSGESDLVAALKKALPRLKGAFTLLS